MEPLFRAVAHGCQAGLHEEVLNDVYLKRIIRGKNALRERHLGAAPAFPACLSAFFDHPWDRPSPQLADSGLQRVLEEAGHYLFVLGRLDEALDVLKEAMNHAANQRDWCRAAEMGRLVREVCLLQGKLDEALRYGKKSKHFADLSRNSIRELVEGAALAQVLNYRGGRSKQKARQLFLEAERIQKQVKRGAKHLLSFAGFWFGEFLLDELEAAADKSSKGRLEQQQVVELAQDLQARAQSIIQDAEERRAGMSRGNVRRIDMAVGKVILAHAQLVEEEIRPARRHAAICRLLDRAVGDLEQTGQQHHLAYGLLARAAYHRVTKRYDKAWRDLNQAWEISQRCGLRIYGPRHKKCNTDKSNTACFKGFAA